MKNLLIIIEHTSTGYSAYIPDLPGCIATAPTREEVKRQIKEAAEFHIEGLKTEGEMIPQVKSESDYIQLLEI